jgi:hypothetical protein
MFKLERAPVIARQRRYGRFFFLKRKDKSVAVKISVIPFGTPTITHYGVRLTTFNDTFSPQEALDISQALALAYSHAKRLETAYVGKPIK